MTGLVNKMLDYLASTHFGQYIIKKVDLLLWSIEKPAKYSVDGKSSGDSPSLPWPIFWIILINLQIYRLVFSTILIQLNKYPIESIDVVKGLQKWRRTLRSIRFRGLRRIREKQYGTSIDGDVTASPPPKETSKKRNHDEMLDHDLLDELMNHTYSDTDNTDSTFMISKFADISTNGSSNYGQSLSEDYQSPLKSKDSLDSSLQDTLPVSASESEHQEPNMSTKTNEGTFVSTVDDTEESAFALTEEDSGHSVNGNAMHSNGSRSTEPTTAQSNGTKKVGKESLNAPTDPVDVMILKMVELEQNGKLNTKKSGKNKNKKRNFSLSSQENIDRQISAKASKSQESLNQL